MVYVLTIRRHEYPLSSKGSFDDWLSDLLFVLHQTYPTYRFYHIQTSETVFEFYRTMFNIIPSYPVFVFSLEYRP